MTRSLREASRLCLEFERKRTPVQLCFDPFFHLIRISETLAELSEKLVVSSHVVHKTIVRKCKLVQTLYQATPTSNPRRTRLLATITLHEPNASRTCPSRLCGFKTPMGSTSSAQLLPPQDGCSVEKRIHVAIQGDHRQSTTVTVAIPQCAGIMPVLDQVLHRGTTVAVLPPQPWAPHRLSWTQWATRVSWWHRVRTSDVSERALGGCFNC
eukprot:2660374-Amphidinium_carterae.2